MFAIAPSLKDRPKRTSRTRCSESNSSSKSSACRSGLSVSLRSIQSPRPARLALVDRREGRIDEAKLRIGGLDGANHVRRGARRRLLMQLEHAAQAEDVPARRNDHPLLADHLRLGAPESGDEWRRDRDRLDGREAHEAPT